ncbi:MAG: hypothetical protein LH472_14090 [Pyrinomonadaceae bacterium]|nr:hypothetical protein [Pyrinomonadaceae bacterium]
MGQITIEVPQRIKRSYKVSDKSFVQKLLKELDGSGDSVKVSAEDIQDVKQARKARIEYQRTGESSTIAELREEFSL